MTSTRYPAPQDPKWMLRGICGDEPFLMSPREDDAKGIEQARRICGNCPVRVDCLTAAMRDEGGTDPYRREGIRGGLTPGERYTMHRAKNRPRKKPRQPRAACGTPEGYARHHRSKEAVCDACRDAHAAAGGELPKVGGGHRKPIKHGTPNGAYQHRNRGEAPCDPCREAYNASQREKRHTKKAPSRKLPGEPIAHGTLRGAFTHKKREVPMCDPCRREYKAYQRERQAAYRARKKKAAA